MQAGAGQQVTVASPLRPTP